MSGKISANSGFVTKVDFLRLQSKVDALVTRLSELRHELRAPVPPTITPASTPSSHRKLTGGVKSWLTSKAGSSASRAPSSDANSECQNCGKAGSTEGRGHELATDANKHIFQKRGQDEGRDNQRCTKNEFNQFRADVTRDIKALQKSFRDLEIFCDNLEKSVKDSLDFLQAALDKTNTQVVASIERLDQLSAQNKDRSLSRSEANGTLIMRNKARHF